jgi:hypothetical protein
LSGVGVSGLTSLAGGGVGSGAGADAGGGGGGGGASSFFLQPAKVKAQANTVIIDNDKNSFFILASRYTKVSQYVLRICGFYVQVARDSVDGEISSILALFDYLICSHQHFLRNRKTDLLCGFKIDHQLEIIWRFNRQLRWLRAF